jgi:ATP-binding cassette subfamily B protein
MPDSPSTTPLARLWRYAEHHRRAVIVATVITVLKKVVDLAPPVLIGMAVDIVVRGEGSWLGGLGIEDANSQIVALAVLTAVIWGLESWFEFVAAVGWRNLAQTIQHELRIDAYTHMQHLEMAYFEDRASGDLMAVLNDDINQLERFLDFGADEVLQMMTGTVLIGVVYFYLSPLIALLAFIPVPIIMWGSFLYQKRLEPRYAAVRDQAAAVNAQLANSLGGMATIKSFNAEGHEVTRIAGESERYRTVNRRAIKLSSAFSPLIRIAILMGFTAALIWGGFFALDGRLEIGAYSVMVFMSQRLLWPLTRLGQTFDLYQRAMASANRVLDVLDTEPGLTGGDQDVADVEGSISFDAVTFEYDEGYPVLREVSLEIRSGQTTAFVGATGSGKTTLVKLMLRFYDPTSGAIELDGKDLRDLRFEALRGAMGLVGQDVYLFHGTVRENIAYGRPDATMEQIRQAARVAEADDFIGELPGGYDTVVGERGQKLSGGQRQRLSIARAVLVDPAILILDEATSAVDNETEAAIQRSLERISIGRTTVVIAHRLSTIRQADRIYVMDAGRIVERGTHEELIEHAGIYKALWDVQTGEAVPWHTTTD